MPPLNPLLKSWRVKIARGKGRFARRWQVGFLLYKPRLRVLIRRPPLDESPKRQANALRQQLGVSNEFSSLTKTPRAGTSNTLCGITCGLLSIDVSIGCRKPQTTNHPNAHAAKAYTHRFSVWRFADQLLFAPGLSKAPFFLSCSAKATHFFVSTRAKCLNQTVVVGPIY